MSTDACAWWTGGEQSVRYERSYVHERVWDADWVMSQAATDRCRLSRILRSVTHSFISSAFTQTYSSSRYQGRSQEFFSTNGKKTSTRRAEVQGPQAESGGGILVEGQPAPPQTPKPPT